MALEGSAEEVLPVIIFLEEQFKMPIPKAWTPLIKGWLKKYPIELIKDVIMHSAHVNIKNIRYVEAALKYKTSQVST